MSLYSNMEYVKKKWFFRPDKFVLFKTAEIRGWWEYMFTLLKPKKLICRGQPACLPA